MTKKDVKDSSGGAGYIRKAIWGAKSAENQPDLSSLANRILWKIFGRSLGSYQKILISDLKRGRFRCNKAQLEVVDDSRSETALPIMGSTGIVPWMYSRSFPPLS